MEEKGALLIAVGLQYKQQVNDNLRQNWIWKGDGPSVIPEQSGLLKDRIGQEDSNDKHGEAA